MKQTRIDLKIDTIVDFRSFVIWAKYAVGLKWECGREIELNDWEFVKNKVCVFWHVDNSFKDFETCASVTYNCKDIDYISPTLSDFFMLWDTIHINSANLSNADLRVIKYLLSMISSDGSVDKLNSLEYYELDETIDMVNQILEKLDYIKLKSVVEQYIDNPAFVDYPW